ncbi:transcription activator effector binding protein [Sporocytophaga myxococcoides]|uniref:Transcription activator effector binding protein n=2 Tax=Sporocytophaga myxococcoides TaxID=153721 RepID=A0A098LIC5_9BACT|nr:transcription activator effector binding protein [Sporocytophaga myxococcoides]
MSLKENKTVELWRSFMPLRNRIINPVSSDLFSLQIYQHINDYMNPESEFVKWAAMEVSDNMEIPQGMDSYYLSGGLYAVFLHKGGPQNFRETFHFIFNEWMPVSGYIVDHREHFELLGEKYKNNEPESEEEIWIPIKRWES